MFDLNGGTAAGPPFKKEQCTDYMRKTACVEESPLQNKSLFYGYTDYQHNKGVLPYFKQDLAAIMLIRGPYARLGYSWMGCNNDPNDHSTAQIKYHFPHELTVDYGEPLGLCAETAAGTEVFVRRWSKATVTVDCKNWNGTITPTGPTPPPAPPPPTPPTPPPTPTPSVGQWHIQQNTNAVSGLNPCKPGVCVSIQNVSSAPDCQQLADHYTASHPDKPCRTFTWHDPSVKCCARECILRVDGVWKSSAEAGHVTGHFA
jgi:hypothetical protein